ncbi:MAG: hypothetical protein BWX70_02625 [Verrucomicrobia bacterium ADurb.Bin070]|nr:MAG: hypothetical protein BWX70_02625 [Verrucomicrobia bacterium ADurb.Bin070]
MAHALGGDRPAQRLVREVPDEAALQVGMGADRAPVVGQVARRVAHRVRVFAEDERDGRVAAATVCLNVTHAGVHGVDQIARPVTLVLDHAARIARFDPAVGVTEEIGVHVVLVAERPEEDRGMVLVALNHAGLAVHRGFAETGVADRVARVAEAMCLEVGLVHHVNPVLIAQVIPARVVGIVAGAYGVDVVALHQQDVFHHAAVRHGIAAVGVHLVAVDAADQDRLAVQQDLAAARFDLAEAHALRDGLDDHAARVPQREQQRVERGIFGRPKARRVDGEVELKAAAYRHGASARDASSLEATRDKLGLKHRRPGVGGLRDARVDLEIPRAVVDARRQRRGSNEEIAQVDLRRRPEVDRPGQAR